MPTASPATATLLGRDRTPHRGLGLVASVDTLARGAVARRWSRSVVRRAEPGPAGPLLLEARLAGDVLECSVWGPRGTADEDVESAIVQLRAWTGQHDEPDVLHEVVASCDVLRRALRRVGEVRLSRLPRVGEAVGRAVIAQLVQSAEAVRSVAQVVRRFGEPVAGGLATWPTAQRLASVPAWELRRCGVSLRGSRALHGAARDDEALQRAALLGPAALDARLRSLSGIGPWTSAEARLALGDPDAVSVGDYHLHRWVTHTLGGVDPRDSSDALMLELLAPFAGQRGRVVTLIGLAYRRGVLAPPPRRAPRAALSDHRYW